jgi:hypothetical protein
MLLRRWRGVPRTLLRRWRSVPRMLHRRWWSVPRILFRRRRGVPRRQPAPCSAETAWPTSAAVSVTRTLAFGSRCNPGTPSLIGLPMWPPCPGCCLAQHSNLALGHGPEMRIPAPLRCGEGKGHPEQCGRRWLHAHENLWKPTASGISREGYITDFGGGSWNTVDPDNL